jgi:hypothetical protein
VRSSPWPAVRLDEIRTEIHKMATASGAGLFNGWGIGGGMVNVRLRADGEKLAAQLHERYGDAVDVTVGFLHFPQCAYANERRPGIAEPQPAPSLIA